MANDITTIREQIADLTKQLSEVDKKISFSNDQLRVVEKSVFEKSYLKFGNVGYTQEQVFEAVRKYVEGFVPSFAQALRDLGLTINDANVITLSTGSFTPTSLLTEAKKWRTLIEESRFLSNERDRIYTLLLQSTQALENAVATAQSLGQINAVEAQNLLTQAAAYQTQVGSVTQLLKENWLPIVGVVLFLLVLAWATLLKTKQSVKS